MSSTKVLRFNTTGLLAGQNIPRPPNWPTLKCGLLVSSGLARLRLADDTLLTGGCSPMKLCWEVPASIFRSSTSLFATWLTTCIQLAKISLNYSNNLLKQTMCGSCAMQRWFVDDSVRALSWTQVQLAKCLQSQHSKWWHSVKIILFALMGWYSKKCSACTFYIWTRLRRQLLPLKLKLKINVQWYSDNKLCINTSNCMNRSRTRLVEVDWLLGLATSPSISKSMIASHSCEFRAAAPSNCPKSEGDAIPLLSRFFTSLLNCMIGSNSDAALYFNQSIVRLSGSPFLQRRK